MPVENCEGGVESGSMILSLRTEGGQNHRKNTACKCLSAFLATNRIGMDQGLRHGGNFFREVGTRVAMSFLRSGRVPDFHL